jgi:hypothetical protein
VKKPHYRGTYHRDSMRLRAAAYANPATRCWRCGETLQQIRIRHPRAKWTAGHTIDTTPGAPLAPECSPCNYAAGARLTHQQRHRTPLTW